MILSFHPCFDADVHVVLGSRSLNAGDLDLINRADAIILPQGRPKDLFKACLNSGAHLFPNYEMRFEYPGKIGQSLLFENLGCSCPETLRWPEVRQYRKTYPNIENIPHELPFLIKDDQSHEAEGVFFVEDRQSLSSALDFLNRRERSGFLGFVTQAYVPSGGNVLRAVIIGRNIITYWKRPAEPGQIITTISKGATIDHLWRPDLQAKGRAECRSLAGKTGIDLAAVDFVFSFSKKDPEPFFLEINYYFGRRGLGGSEKYYQLFHQAIRDWMEEVGLDPEAVKLI
jgi:ribosomal protein S6--L-glutamate ligase